MNCTTETNKRMFNELRESSFVEPSLKILPVELFARILLFLQSPKAISNVACLNKSFREKVKVENSSIHFIPLKHFLSALLLKISGTDCIQSLSALEKEVSLNPCYDLKPLKKKLLQFQKAILVVLRSLDRQTFDDLVADRAVIKEGAAEIAADDPLDPAQILHVEGLVEAVEFGDPLADLERDLGDRKSVV